MNQTYPFYLKLSCILISIVILGFLAIIGEQILIPMVLGLLIAILLMPLSRFMEKRLRFPRSVSSILASLLALAIIGGVIYVLSLQVAKLANDWPQFQKQFIDLTDDLQSWISRTFGVRRKDQLVFLNDTAKKSISTGTEGGNSCPNSNHYKVSSKLLLIALCPGGFPSWKRQRWRRHFQ